MIEIIFQLMEIAADTLYLLPQEAASRKHEDKKDYFTEAIKRKSIKIVVDCPNCHEKFDYRIDNEQWQKAEKGEPVQLITTCPSCKKVMIGKVDRK